MDPGIEGAQLSTAIGSYVKVHASASAPSWSVLVLQRDAVVGTLMEQMQCTVVEKADALEHELQLTVERANIGILACAWCIFMIVYKEERWWGVCVGTFFGMVHVAVEVACTK